MTRKIYFKTKPIIIRKKKKKKKRCVADNVMGFTPDGMIKECYGDCIEDTYRF